MRIIVAGAGGMLGQDLVAVLRGRGHAVTAAARAHLDVTDPLSCASAVAGHEVVVNCAAYTAVDDAEGNEPLAFAVNAAGAAVVARAARNAGARMVHLSTDYVFSGDASAPYAEDAPLAPVSAYGRSKAAGEWAVRAECPDSFVVRTAWLYGAGGPSFVRTMARLAARHETLDVVDDQRGQPTATSDLARFIGALVESDAPPGAYHGTCEGEATWCGLAREVFRLLGLDPGRVRPTTTEAYPRPARRPAYSVLGHAKWRAHDLPPMPGWQSALAATIADVVADPGRPTV